MSSIIKHYIISARGFCIDISRNMFLHGKSATFHIEVHNSEPFYFDTSTKKHFNNSTIESSNIDSFNYEPVFVDISTKCLTYTFHTVLPHLGSHAGAFHIYQFHVDIGQQHFAFCECHGKSTYKIHTIFVAKLVANSLALYFAIELQMLTSALARLASVTLSTT